MLISTVPWMLGFILFLRQSWLRNVTPWEFILKYEYLLTFLYLLEVTIPKEMIHVIYYCDPDTDGGYNKEAKSCYYRLKITMVYLIFNIVFI